MISMNSTEAFSITTFLVLPMTIILIVSLVNVFIAIRGKFHPMDVMWRGLGGAIYLFGYGWVVTDGMNINQLSGSILMWGIAIKLIPRFIQLVLPQVVNSGNASRT